MKILYVTHSSELQGAGIALCNIVLNLPSKVKPVVILPTHGPLYEIFMKKGICVYIQKMYNEVLPKHNKFTDMVKFLPRLIRIYFYNFIAYRAIDKIVKSEKPDIIHTNTGVLHFMSDIAKHNSVPHVWHIREFQRKGSGYYPLGGERRFVKKLNALNNYCVTITRSIFDYYNLSNKKDCVIYDGVYNEEAVRNNKNIVSNNKNYFLYVGAVMQSKGVEDLLQAFNNICKLDKNIKLYLVGADWMNIENHISHTGCPNRICYLGFRNDVYDLMKHAVAVIVPSFYEGFGFVVAESMINNCLVIGRNTTGIKEQFDNGVNCTGGEVGFRFSSIEELEDCMLQAIKGKYDVSMKQRAFDTAKNYTIENNIHNLIEVYESLQHF